MKYLKKFNININESKVYNGDFRVSENQVINGKFKENSIPEIINGYFDCFYIRLTTLEGSPEIVKGDFYCDDNFLVSLVGGPKEVNGHFDCSTNKLTNLIGSPEIKGVFYCSNNLLTSLYGISKNVKGVVCDDNLKIEREFINSGSYKNEYWNDLLNYCIYNKENLDEINWPENFLNDNLKKSVKGINKFNI